MEVLLAIYGLELHLHKVADHLTSRGDLVDSIREDNQQIIHYITHGLEETALTMQR